MNAQAPAILMALEGSGLGERIRSSVWLYPTANVLHVVAVTGFVSAVVVMDLALAGVIGSPERARLAQRARRFAIALFLLVLASGSVLFIAEASHVAMNPVFQIKVGLITLALLNALIPGRRAMAAARADVSATTTGVYHVAWVSLVLWFLVVAAGRLIAYY